jgi:competence protein ComEA
MSTHRPGTLRSAARRTLAGLGCTPAELAALAILLAGALAALGLLWLLVGPRPVGTPVEAHPAVPEGVAVEAGEVVVHVGGRVMTPGVYRLPGGARVGDAVDRAGGALPDAVLDAVNLARPLTDGEQLVVPGPDAATPGATVAPGSSPGPGPAAAASARRPDGTLDLNRATAADLDELPGIGPVLTVS